MVALTAQLGVVVQSLTTVIAGTIVGLVYAPTVAVCLSAFTPTAN